MESKIVTELTPDELADMVVAKLSALVLQHTKATPTEIIDRAELCRRLNLTEPTIIRMEKRGEIPAMHAGTCVRYNWQKVIEAMEKKEK